MPDPKLKTAMAEIKAVLDKHDIAGQVILNSVSHTEYLIKIDPSWSCAWFEDTPQGCRLRVRARAVDYGGDREKSRAAQSVTIGMMMGFHDTAHKLVEMMHQMVITIGKTLDFEHRTTDES